MDNLIVNQLTPGYCVTYLGPIWYEGQTFSYSLSYTCLVGEEKATARERVVKTEDSWDDITLFSQTTQP